MGGGSLQTFWAPIALVLCAGLASAVPAAAQEPRQTVEQSSDLDYLLYLPNGHDPTRKWPLVLFLHGYGERAAMNMEGEPLSALRVHSLPSVVEAPGWDWPFIVVSPQINEEGWITRAADLSGVVDRMVSEFGADPNRLYLTGLSYGGRGTWEVGLEQIDRWAALMPLCSDPAGLEADDRESLVSRPLFVVHGTIDPTDNDFATMEGFIQSFAADGTPFFQFEYARRDEHMDLFPRDVLAQRHVFARMINYQHDVWSATYGRIETPLKTVPYEWLLAQSLDGSAFVDPRDPAYDTMIAEQEAANGPPATDSGCALRAPAEGQRTLSFAGLLAAAGLLAYRRPRSRAELG